MLKFHRTKRWGLLVLITLASLGAGSLSATPINSITVLVSATNFEAGVTTNTVTTQIFVNVFNSTNSAPTAGEGVLMELLDSGTVVNYGMFPTTFTTAGGIVNGGNLSFPITLYRASSNLSIRATSAINGAVGTSSTFAVVVSSAQKIVVLGPGQTHVPGTNPSLTSGKSGSITAPESNSPFTMRVILTDNQFNKVSANDTVQFTSDPTLITLPSNGALSSGQADFQATITGPNVTRTITVDDLTNAAVADGTLTLTSAAPPSKKVFPFPNPFNPTQGTITFRFRLDNASSANLIVTDRFGQSVWSRSVSAQTGSNDVTWDGRNDNGHVVAAGIYYVMLENGGTIESRVRFGVTK